MPRQRAQARWLEEYADTRIGDVIIWRVFYEAVVLPFIFQKPRDKEKIAKASRRAASGTDGLSREDRTC